MDIRFVNLTKKFGDVIAVNNLSVTVSSGKLIALLGPSGCGKSTLLFMLAGITPVTEGRIYFDGKDVTTLAPEKRGVGLVFQNYALYPHMTVLQNICFPLEMKRMPKSERLEKAHYMADLVHISDLLDRKPSELSGGQQQRVAITRALVKEPELLLLDEPLSNLDARLRIEMREEIRRIQTETGVTTIFVTHDQEEAISISDEILLLKLGKEQQYDHPQTLYDNPKNRFVAEFLGTPPINTLEGVIKDNQLLLSPDLRFRGGIDISGIEDGTPVILAIRAESIIVSQNDVKKCFDAEVTQIFCMGKENLMHLRIGGQEIRGILPIETAVKLGDRLPIALKGTGVFLFDAQTGVRYQ